MGFILAIFSLNTSLLSADECNIIPSKLPKCPLRITKIAPKNFPAQVFYFDNRDLSELEVIADSLEEGQVLALPKNYNSLTLATNPKNKGKIIILNDSVASKSSTAETSRPLSIPNPTGYQRDFTVFGFDSATGTIIQNVRKSNMDESFNFSMCGLRVKQVDAGDKMGGEAANLGGNILGFPGGGCMVGENMDLGLARSLCGEGNPLIRLNVTGTTVGHIDELINIIPSNENESPCNFSITVPSISEMNALLEKDPNDLFFDPKQNNPPFKADGSPFLRNNGPGTWNGNSHQNICEKLELLSLLKNIENHQKTFFPGAIDKNSNGRSVFLKKFINLFMQEATAGVSSVPTNDNCDDSPLRKSSMKPGDPKTAKDLCTVKAVINEYKYTSIKPTPFKCSEVKNKDVLELLKIDASRIDSVINKIPKYKDGVNIKEHLDLISNLSELKLIPNGNQEIQEGINANMKTLKANLPAECTNKNMITTLPYLFDGSRSINPNPANLLVVGKTSFIPKQFNSKVTDLISKKMSSAGLKTRELPTFSQHVGGGNVHCLTNEIRGCSQ